MTKICTTIDQCKKILELGIDINTADLTITNYPLQDGSRFDFICCKLPNDTFPSITDGKSEKIPAWSLSALVDLMPKNVEIERTHIGWRCDYYSNSDSLLKFGKDKNTLFDAVYEMVVWLLENNKI